MTRAADRRDEPVRLRTTGAAADSGSILVLTLLLTVVLAAIVLALATYAISGLRTSDVTARRIDDDVAAANVVNWAIEEFAKKQLTPEDDCGPADGDALALTGSESISDVSVSCQQTGRSSQIRLIATVATQSGGIRETVVLVEVPAGSYEAFIRAWSVG